MVIVRDVTDRQIISYLHNAKEHDERYRMGYRGHRPRIRENMMKRSTRRSVRSREETNRQNGHSNFEKRFAKGKESTQKISARERERERGGGDAAHHAQHDVFERQGTLTLKTRACMYACVRACVHVCVHACMYACVRACIFFSIQERWMMRLSETSQRKRWREYTLRVSCTCDVFNDGDR